ncbi:hypothetical protein AK812_SmicGene17658 [Symbiodinium microadriaticum]|uniref:Uncharacterized protein n=1 Tax=Symbiodinium microadriaticum TaxID=2951 RepID=A0A1Q9DX62_SYMMI|nr:hypothetical protein AK812_SmicGene17658 [Symbiodinium microadriaticum]
MLPLTVFFDDYTADTAITLEQDCHSLTQSFLLLLKLLGWQAALTGSKATDFAESFVSLGIAYILPRTLHGFVRVHNTDSRKREVATTCLRILQSGALSPAEALAFAGRLRWLDAQTFGRIGRWAFRVILEHGTKPGRRSQRQLTPAVADAVNWILDNVPQAAPRAFKVPSAKAIQVFTDGSFEQGLGRLGGECPANSSQAKEHEVKDPVFQFVVQDRCFLDNLQETLLSQPDPVPLPQPVSQTVEAKSQPASLPTPKLRALGQWKPQDSQAERQAALSKWSQLFRAVPHLFRPETVSEVVHESSRTELGNLDMRFAKKSTNTLLNRVSSLQRFAAWLLRSFPHEPLSEALVFLYCQNVTSQTTGSSVPDQLSQALNFADG